MSTIPASIPMETISGEDTDVTLRIDSVESTHDRLQRVFMKCADGLYRFILIRVGMDRTIADDLLQQTCHESVRSTKLPLDDEECEAWMRGIARNLVSRHWRNHARGPRLVAFDSEEISQQLADDMVTCPISPDLLTRTETRQQLLLAITELSNEDQRYVYAFYFDGRSQADVAREEGTSVKSVEMKMYRIRNRMRAILQRSKG